jgi:hypothetical protein
MEKELKTTGPTSGGKKRAPMRLQPAQPVSSVVATTEWANNNAVEREFYAAMGARLNRARRALKVPSPRDPTHLQSASLQQVVDRVAVTQLCPQQLQKYEVGSARPHCFVLQQLADVLGVSVDYLMKGKV